MTPETTEKQKTEQITETVEAAGCGRIVNVMLVLFGVLFALTAGWFVSKRLQGLRVPTPAIIVMMVMAVGMIASLRVRAAHRPKVLMMVLSILMTMYLFEGFLSWFGNPLDYDNDRFMAALARGQVIDKRMAIDVFIDMEDAGEEITLALPAAELLNKRTLPVGKDGKPIFPIGNISNTQVVYCNELGEHIIYETDEYGFHNPRGIWEEEIDIAIIGDSFANGACVPSDQNGVARIRELYPRTVTVGSSGSGPLLELAALKEYVAPFKPPVVLWWYFEGNDILETQSEKSDAFITQYLEPGFTQSLIGRQDEIDQVRHDYIDNIEQLRRDEIPDATDWQPDEDAPFSVRRFVTLFQLRRLLRIDFLPLDSVESADQDKARSPSHRARVAGQEETAEAEKEVEVAEKEKETPEEEADRKAYESREHYLKTIEELPENLSILKRTLIDARDMVHGWDGEFIIVYIPQWERYEFETEDWTFQRREVRPLLDELDVPIIDLKIAMDEHEDPLSLYPFRINGHYNAEGYQFMADVITAELEAYDSLLEK